MDFSAKDDKWEIEYRRRTGLPLVKFRNRWESLRLLTPGSPTPDVGMGSVATMPEGSGIKMTESVRDNIKIALLRELARRYLSSFPGLDEKAGNPSLHSRLRSVTKGSDEFSLFEIDWMLDQVGYRIDRMRDADRILQTMGVEFLSIAEFKVDRPLIEHYKEALRLVSKAKLFDPPKPLQGHAYRKPVEYLAIALVQYDNDEIQMRVDVAVADKHRQLEALRRGTKAKV
ncbi:hypothetical protein AJ79_04756 [Helicocarpus griseus UAMH5409]|uniref:Uncharacterized protein n=1 Tax=Helicocarpus griseus UAMH5409 TaxID=1447875 RepID=A0A2B7XQX7_9EURO|nr:hypothetical protein AJ79_04756 [Helicocarpus griseus UAMH5409]